VGTSSVVDIISGTGISCETAPHYLAFDVNDFVEIGSALKISPPVKQPQNKDKLWDHLRNGKISLVATDHAPATLPEKNTGSIWTDYSGIPGCETMIPYVFSEGFLKKRISLSRYLQITSENAAERYGIFDKKGSIEVGKDADFTIINPNEETKIIGEKFYSKGKVTPFENMLFTGKIKNTIVRGKAVYTSLKGIAASAGYGNLIKAK
jgi:dihydroorotase-like cyclic amidohydrolase